MRWFEKLGLAATSAAVVTLAVAPRFLDLFWWLRR